MAGRTGQAPSIELTTLLQAWRDGDPAALEQLTSIVYNELRQIARRCLQRERPDHTLQTTALVNEAWVRLFQSKCLTVDDRPHFFALCAKIMRQILLDHARARLQAKRGGAAVRIPLEASLQVSNERGAALVALDDALNSLEQLDPRKLRVVELRFFGGLSIEETAQVLAISPDSVKRDWRLARLWLARELDHASESTP